MGRHPCIRGAALFLAFSGLSALAHAQAPQSCGGVFPVAADATLDREQPVTPLGETDLLEVAGFAGGQRSLLLRFDLRAAIPPGSTIHRVMLELPDILSDPGAITFEVLPVENDWEEWAVTWSWGPVVAGPGVTRAMEFNHAGATIDLTDFMTAWATGTSPTADFELAATNYNEEIILRSREGGAGPLLHVACSAPSPQLVAAADGDDAVQLQALNLLREVSSRPVSLRLDGGAITSAEMGIPTPANLADDPLARADWFLNQYSGLLRCASPSDDLQLARRSPDGMHLFYRQRHAGVPVFPGELGVHLSRDEVVGLSGRYTIRIDLDEVPRLDSSLARALSVAAAGAGAAADGTTTLTYLDLRTMKHGDEQVHLAWRTTVTGGTTPGTSFVDAVSGQVLLTLPLDEGAFVLRLSTGRGANPSGGFPNTCWFPTTADVLWFNEGGPVGPTPSSQGDTAFANAGAIDSFWRGTLGRDGPDGIGGGAADYIHVNLNGNAQYNGRCNIYEFGENQGVLDVMGHEFAHGVIRFEAGLVYLNESGALNESYADLFAHMVDPSNFTIGEGAGAPLRTLNNPPAGCGSGAPDCTVLPSSMCSPDHVLASVSGDRCGKRGLGSPVDNGWVHINSGINNKVGSLIIAGGTHNGYTITGVGRPKAGRLFHDLLTNRLGPNSLFIDARDQSIAAARANPLFTPQDVCAVRNAYASVGLGTGDGDCDGIDDIADTDGDGDGAPDLSDNCPIPNPGQEDRDQDGEGDACDMDKDGDFRANSIDNCIVTPNPGQEDWDGDMVGDVCDDSDVDSILDAYDNCRTVANRGQMDSDGDRIGDACDGDTDNDGLPNGSDNCPGLSNPNGLDADGDGVGDLCDNCSMTAGVSSTDFSDPDRDGFGNVCDPDDDGDGVPDATDNCPSLYNPSQADFDFDGNGTGCDIFETRMLYEEPRFWEQGRFIKWEIPDSALEIPLPVCPGCPGAFLPHGFTEILTLQSDVNINLRVVDRAGMTRANDYTFGPNHQLAFRPAAFGKSLFDYGGFFDGGPQPVIPTDLSRIVHPDQEAYSLLVYPEPGTDITGYHTLQMVVHQCADVDGDGFYAGDEACLTLSPADCEDKDAARFPGNPEVCDNKDNDCDGTIDSVTTQCGLGACASAGFCTDGLDSCQPYPPGQEVCDGADNDCDGLADNGPPPAATIDVSLSGSFIFWDALPDTSAWDITYGSLGSLSTSQGDFSIATQGCLAHRTTASGVIDSLVPAPGEGFWVLVRGYNCVGAGSYDEAGAAPRDAEMNASLVGCQDCSHSLCSVGARLTPTCDPCAGYVCSFDPYCCDVLWDSLCVAEADTGCGLGCS